MLGAFSAAVIFTTTITVIFTSLGLVALALALLARRYSGFAFALGLTGLFALTTASTWMIYARPGIDVQVIDKLKEEISRLKSQIETGNKELQSSHYKIDEMEKQVKAEREERDRIRKELATAQDRLVEVGQLKTNLEAALETAGAERDAAKRERAELEKKLQHVPPLPTQPEGRALDRDRLRQRLAEHLDTPFYTSEPLEQRSLVTGLTGSWYLMHLKVGGNRLVFADGKFRAPETVLEIKESALQLQKDVLAPVEEVAKIRLYLRGGADYRRLLGSPDLPEAPELVILPRVPDDGYAAKPRRLRLAVPIRNQDLPNLRANWVRQVIGPVLAHGTSDIRLLHNAPSDNQERTVDLILYVDW